MIGLPTYSERGGLEDNCQIQSGVGQDKEEVLLTGAANRGYPEVLPRGATIRCYQEVPQ